MGYSASLSDLARFCLWQLAWRQFDRCAHLPLSLCCALQDHRWRLTPALACIGKTHGAGSHAAGPRQTPTCSFCTAQQHRPARKLGLPAGSIRIEYTGIPEGWGNLLNLSYIDFFWNELSGTIPEKWPPSLTFFGAGWQHVCSLCIICHQFQINSRSALALPVCPPAYAMYCRSITVQKQCHYQCLTASLWLQLTGQMPAWSNITMPKLLKISVDSNHLQGDLPLELIRCAITGIKTGKCLPAWPQPSMGTAS